jgi:hypothetical protein
MGYSTNLYVVDLDALAAAVGSKDAALLKRFSKEAGERAKKLKREDQGPRIKLTRKSEIVLNGQHLSWDEFVREMHRPKWRGTYVYEFQEPGKRTGSWSKPGSFPIAVGKACADTKFMGTICCSSEEELLSGWEDGDEISEKQAAADLVAGRVTRPGDAHQYGYALERLCRMLGTPLGAIEGKRGILSHLGLDTRLREKRSPVRLPRRDDFPVIGFLTADEVQGELEGLRALDLSFPQSAEIEHDRRTFFKCLQNAAKKGVGIVAFYY